MPRTLGHGAPERLYLVSYAGQMPADRAALSQPGFVPDPNGFEVLSRNRRGEWSPTPYQMVRVTAAGAEDARHRVIEALGREPDDLRASRAYAP
jgi:hypothetical protein